MRITLLHPSYGRPELAKKALGQWAANAVGDFQHILVLDQRDKTKEKYLKLFADTSSLILQAECDNVVCATNAGAEYADGEFIIYMSDDFEAPKSWDETLKLIVAEKELSGSKYLLQVSDGYQSDRAILTIPIMSKALYNELGYFWYPSYRSMFVDNDLYFTCKDLNCLVDARDKISFQHNHFSNGKAANDETYKQSQKNWNQGKELFRKRCKENRWNARI